MKHLFLIRHSLTQANESHLYCGWTDVPLTRNGRDLAIKSRRPEINAICDCYATSGMLRANETLALLCDRTPDETFSDMKEMNFGSFEMHSYAQLLDNPDYIRWIEDSGGDYSCPGGESRKHFHNRVISCANRLLLKERISNMLMVCHGGVIANIMAEWFPDEPRNFYEWQPSACCGYEIDVENGRAVRFKSI